MEFKLRKKERKEKKETSTIVSRLTIFCEPSLLSISFSFQAISGTRRFLDPLGLSLAETVVKPKQDPFFFFSDITKSGVGCPGLVSYSAKLLWTQAPPLLGVAGGPPFLLALPPHCRQEEGHQAKCRGDGPRSRIRTPRFLHNGLKTSVYTKPTCKSFLWQLYS